MLHTKLLRSTVPHARIVHIDVSKAKAYPGVHAVLTGADLPLITYGELPVSEDEHPLAVGKVRMVGDPVVAVAAVDEDVATEAPDLIHVEYELLPVVTSIPDAYAMQEPRSVEYVALGNMHRRQVYEFGSVEAGFAEADHVREDITFYEGSTHLALEQHASLAQFSHDGKLTLWTSTQDMHYLHRHLAKVLEMPASHIRVIATPNGGGFGGKCDPFNHEIVVCKLAMVTGRPVKICLTREEVFYCHRGRHPVLMSTKTGYKKDGSITAMHHRTILDGGAYGGHGVASTFYTGILQPTTYKLPNYRFEAVRVFTNKAPCGPKRGHGTPQQRWAQEIQMDRIAEQLGIDPFDIRVVTGDTDLTPVDLGSYSSRVTLMTGNAAIQAAQRAREILRQAVSEKLEVPDSRLMFADRRVFDTENPEKGMSFVDAVWLAEEKFGTLGTTGSYKPPAAPGKYKGATIGPSPAFSCTAAIAEVEVNPETGIIVVPRIWIAHDIGQAINPVLAVGQIEGCVYMGLGEALMEEMAYRGNRNLVHKFPSFLEYKSPTTLEMCDVITYLVEEPDANGPFGAKEVGQGPQLPVPPAIANAVYGAVGIRIDEVPITPDKVLKAIRAKAKGQEGRYGPSAFPTCPMPAAMVVPTPWQGGDGKALEREPALTKE